MHNCSIRSPLCGQCCRADKQAVAEPPAAGNTLTDVHVFDSLTAIAVGGGTVIKTTNGGSTWTIQNHVGGVTGGLRAIQHKSTTTNYARFITLDRSSPPVQDN